MTHYCSDVDGVLCITACEPDYNEPKIVHNHYPTRFRTHDVLSFFGVDSVDQLQCSATHPGEYFVQVRDARSAWKCGQRVSLLDGAHTLPISGHSVPVPPPKVRNGTQVWWNGYLGCWIKKTSRGTVECR